MGWLSRCSSARERLWAWQEEVDLSPPPSPGSAEEEEQIPEHWFDINKTVWKSGANKGKERETVTLMLGNYIFWKRRTLKDGTLLFACNGCEKEKVTMSALVKVTEDRERKFELLEWPRSAYHTCWADGNLLRTYLSL